MSSAAASSSAKAATGSKNGSQEDIVGRRLAASLASLASRSANTFYYPVTWNIIKILILAKSSPYSSYSSGITNTRSNLTICSYLSLGDSADKIVN